MRIVTFSRWITFPASVGVAGLSVFTPDLTPTQRGVGLSISLALLAWAAVGTLWHIYRNRKSGIDINLTAYQFAHYLTDESDWGWRVRNYRRQAPEFLRDLAADIRLNGPMMVPGEFQRVAQVASNDLTVSGTRKGAACPEKIDPVFWTVNSLSLESTCVPTIGETAPSTPQSGERIVYDNIRINHADAVRLWPRRNIIKRLIARFRKPQ